MYGDRTLSAYLSRERRLSKAPTIVLGRMSAASALTGKPTGIRATEWNRRMVPGLLDKRHGNALPPSKVRGSIEYGGCPESALSHTHSGTDEAFARDPEDADPS